MDVWLNGSSKSHKQPFKVDKNWPKTSAYKRQ